MTKDNLLHNNFLVLYETRLKTYIRSRPFSTGSKLREFRLVESLKLQEDSRYVQFLL